jgi:hypothetical protein
MVWVFCEESNLISLKKKPFLVATAPSDAFKKNLSISLDPRIEDNDMQDEYSLVPNNGPLEMCVALIGSMEVVVPGPL